MENLSLLLMEGITTFQLKMTKKADSTSFTQRLQELQKLMASENMTQNPQEHWYSITLMNIKIGYMHSSTEKVEYQGETVDRNKVDIVMNFKALGTAVQLKLRGLSIQDLTQCRATFSQPPTNPV